MVQLSSADRQELQAAYELSEQRHIALARTNIRAFVSYVMRDEQTGAPVDLSAMHSAWHYLADQYDRLIIWSFPESGKTANLSVARTLFKLGRNPSTLYGICSGSDEMATKIAGLCGQYISDSAELHRVFPNLRPDRNAAWNSDRMTVVRPTKSKDPSINVISVGSNFQGSRFNEVILDDILNYANTRTAHMRDEMERWYLASVPGRLNPQNGRAVLLANAFHPDDLAHRLAKNSRWKAYKFPIRRKDGTPFWPERWGEESIRKRAAELMVGGSVWEVQRQLMLQVRSDETSRFQEAWIKHAMARGEGKDMSYGLRVLPFGCKIFIGTDLGIKKKETSAKTVFFVLLIHPNGDREPLWVEGKKRLSPEIKAEIEKLYLRFPGGVFIVENNQAQDYLVQDMHASTAIPIYGFTTGANKADPTFGVEAMTASFAAGKWIIPNRGGICDPEIQQWIEGLYSYTPTAHVSDYVMAGWFAHVGETIPMGKLPPKVGAANLKLSKW